MGRRQSKGERSRAETDTNNRTNPVRKVRANSVGLGRVPFSGRVLVLVSLGLNLAATLLLSASHLAEATTFLPVIAWVVLAGLSWYARFPAGAVATRSQVG